MFKGGRAMKGVRAMKGGRGCAGSGKEGVGMDRIKIQCVGVWECRGINKRLKKKKKERNHKV